jgi:hypothetical protein
MKLYGTKTDGRFHGHHVDGACFLGEVDDILGARLICWAKNYQYSLIDELAARFTRLYGDTKTAMAKESAKHDRVSQLMLEHAKRVGCSTALDFSERTLLNPSFYGQFKSGRHFKREAKTIWSIIAGLKLRKDDALELLSAARIMLLPNQSRVDRVYDFMLNNLEGRSIEEWNVFLHSMGLPLLGSAKRT